MTAQDNQTISEPINRYFSHFESTLTLVSELASVGKFAAEVLILLCARLDALASEAAPEGTPSKQAFVDFVTAYGGDRDLFQSVSIADLYYELSFHRWLLQGTLPEPGRLHRFSRIDDPILHLLEDAGLPLTLEDSMQLFNVLLRTLRRKFRAAPKQPISKPRLAGISQLTQELVAGAHQSQIRRVSDNLGSALVPLLRSKKVGVILYEKYRSQSIHGAKLLLNDRSFFKENGIYWEGTHSPYYGSFELICFSASFLISLLNRCLATYRSHLLKKAKLPPDVHFHAFPNDPLSLDLMDHSLLPEGGRLRFKIGDR